MKNNTQKIILSFMVICLFTVFSGCANKYVIRRKHKTLSLKENEGAVLFSVKIKNNEKPDAKIAYSIMNLNLKEINQYKPFKKKPIKIIPFIKENYEKQDDLFLFSLKLPEGRYRLTHFFGTVRTFWGIQYFIGCNKLFDVVPRKVSYLGRIEVELAIIDKKYTHSMSIDDYYEEDMVRFKNSYLTLGNQRITKDLFF